MKWEKGKVSWSLDPNFQTHSDMNLWPLDKYRSCYGLGIHRLVYEKQLDRLSSNSLASRATD